MSPASAASMASAKSSKVFRGDDDSLVDQLIAASQEHKISTAPLPGFGRELKPYFEEGEFVPPPSAVKRTSPARTDTPVSSDPAQRANNFSIASAAPVSAPVLGKKKKSMTVDIVKKNVTKGKFPCAPPPVQATPGAPACPGIFSSPNPQLLPKPSLSLLKRATSPPPSNCMVANQMIAVYA